MKSINMFFLFFLVFLQQCYSKEVILSSGIGNYAHQDLWNQYTAFKTYGDKNIISASSILLYYINDNGLLEPYKTSDTYWTGELYQQYIKHNTGLKSFPTLYCDATIGQCSNFNERIEKLYLNMSYFIKDSIVRAKLYNYDGYIVDFEPDSTINSTKITDFILEWNSALNYNNLSLNLWIGGNTPYDFRILNVSNLLLTTMNTYDNDYETFITTATQLQVNVNDVSRLGFGLLTNYGSYNVKQQIHPLNIFEHANTKDTPIHSSDLANIVDWLALTQNTFLSLWTSHIDPLWHIPLNKFIQLSGTKSSK